MSYIDLFCQDVSSVNHESKAQSITLSRIEKEHEHVKREMHRLRYKELSHSITAAAAAAANEARMNCSRIPTSTAS